MNLTRRMLPEQAHADGALLCASGHSDENQQQAPQHALHFCFDFHHALKISSASGAASPGPVPRSRKTTTTISGLSAGAYPANQPFVQCPSLALGVPVLPATFNSSGAASLAMP